WAPTASWAQLNHFGRGVATPSTRWRSAAPVLSCVLCAVVCAVNALSAALSLIGSGAELAGTAKPVPAKSPTASAMPKARPHRLLVMSVPSQVGAVHGIVDGRSHGHY